MTPVQGPTTARSVRRALRVVAAAVVLLLPALTSAALVKLDEADKARKLAASGAKVQIGKAGKLISQDAVQIHGGMGMTDELNVGHFFKRVTMIESQFGTTDWHLRRYTELSNA